MSWDTGSPTLGILGSDPYLVCQGLFYERAIEGAHVDTRTRSVGEGAHGPGATPVVTAIRVRVRDRGYSDIAVIRRVPSGGMQLSEGELA